MAVDTLTELIRAGMPPDAAMETLNGTFVLRDNGSFSTMDILEVNLISGQGVLYKWGAAPSYLRSGGGVLRLGHAAPPPGLSEAPTVMSVRKEIWPFLFSIEKKPFSLFFSETSCCSSGCSI